MKDEIDEIFFEVWPQLEHSSKEFCTGSDIV